MFCLVKCTLVVLAATAASSYNLGDRDVVFHLFTRANPQRSEELFPSVGSIMTSSFSLSRRTIVTIHSNGETVSGNFNTFVIQGHLSADDLNIVAVDWSPGSVVYTEGLANAPQCGRVIADFMNIVIRQFGYDPNLLRIVGIGLGGHIAGIAARRIEAIVPQIIALDPSLFGWTHHPEILRHNDASVVEVIHTTAGDMGYDYPLGDLDFYPNGGRSQPGCGSNTNCSHASAYLFYSESIAAEASGGNKFIGIACDNYKQAVYLACTGPRDVIFGGFEAKIFASGIYTFVTNIAPPFAMG